MHVAQVAMFEPPDTSVAQFDIQATMQSFELLSACEECIT
jgi:hypothetical protein